MDRAVAYLPGLEGTGDLLYAHEPALAERYRVVKVPWRTDDAFSLQDLVADVLRSLDGQGIDRATLLAESFGGMVALQLALDHPDRIERLVLLNTFPYFRGKDLLRAGRMLTHAPHRVAHFVRLAVDTPLLRIEGIPEEARHRFFAAADSQPLHAYRRRIDLISAFDVRERLREIRVPTLVVMSERDRVVPSAHSHTLAERIPGARLRLLPRAGHAALLTPGVSALDLVDEALAMDYSLS